jgi:hypothetical protein
MISFGMDWHWRAEKSTVPVVRFPASAIEIDTYGDGQDIHDHRSRMTVPHAAEEYSLVNYLAYCLYPPLNIAGPIMTFNDFLRQVSLLTQPIATHTETKTPRCGARSLYPGAISSHTYSDSCLP